MPNPNLVELSPTINSSSLTFSVPTSPYDPRYTSIMEINLWVPSTVYDSVNNPGDDRYDVVINGGNLACSSFEGYATIDPSTNVINFTISGYMNGKRPHTGGGVVQTQKIINMLKDLQATVQDVNVKDSFDKIFSELIVLQNI